VDISKESFGLSLQEAYVVSVNNYVQFIIHGIANIREPPVSPNHQVSIDQHSDTEAKIPLANIKEISNLLKLESLIEEFRAGNTAKWSVLEQFEKANHFVLKSSSTNALGHLSTGENNNWIFTFTSFENASKFLYRYNQEFGFTPDNSPLKIETVEGEVLSRPRVQQSTLGIVLNCHDENTVTTIDNNLILREGSKTEDPDEKFLIEPPLWLKYYLTHRLTMQRHLS